MQFHQGQAQVEFQSHHNRRAVLSTPHEVHNLNSVPVFQPRGRPVWPSHDLPVALDRHGVEIKTQLIQEASQGNGRRQASPLAVQGDQDGFDIAPLDPPNEHSGIIPKRTAEWENSSDRNDARAGGSSMIHMVLRSIHDLQQAEADTPIHFGRPTEPRESDPNASPAPDIMWSFQ